MIMSSSLMDLERAPSKGCLEQYNMYNVRQSWRGPLRRVGYSDRDDWQTSKEFKCVNRCQTFYVLVIMYWEHLRAYLPLRAGHVYILAPLVLLLS